MTRLRGLWHASLTVSDLERSVAFYAGTLGLELVARQRQANAYTRTLVGYADADLAVAQLRVPGAPVGPSGHHVELVQYLAPASDTPVPPRHAAGAAHLAFVVDDAQAEHARLVAAGVRFVSPPVAITEGVNRGGATCYFLDPDGITVEIVQPPRRDAA